MTAVIDWDLAERVAVRFSGREPFADSYHYDSLAPDFAELTAMAEDRVVTTTGLVSTAGPARARVVDRPAWIAANLASFQRLLRPLTDKLGERMGASPLAPVTQKIAGAEVGALLGWMSTRVLGQYDLLVVEDEDLEDQDIVYYVGPNVLALEKRFAFPPREFRLWLALHEVTHRAQFTGIPWLRKHFLGLVDEVVGAVDPDPKRFIAAMARVADDLREGRKPLDDGGLAAVLANPEQRVVLDQVARADEPARGPRRRDHGPGRGRPDPVGRPLRPGAAPTAPADQRPGPAAPAADRPRGQAGPVRAGRAVHRGHRGRAAARRPWTRCGRTRRACRPWPRSGTPPGGWPGSTWPLRSAAMGLRDDLPGPLPVPGTGVRRELRGLRRGRLARPARAGRGRRLSSHRRPRRPRPPARLRTGGRPGGGRGRPLRRPLPVRAGHRAARARTSRPGPGRPATGSCPPTCSRATPPTTRPRRAAQPPAGGRASGAGRHAPRPSAARCSTCAGPRPRPSAWRRAWIRWSIPTNDDPTHRRNRVRHEVLPLLDDVAGRSVVPVLARQAELLGEETEYLDRMAAALDPTDTRALQAAAPALVRRALRAWLWREHGGRPPGRRRGGRPRPGRRPARLPGHRRPGGWRVVRTEGRLTLDRA